MGEPGRAADQSTAAASQIEAESPASPVPVAPSADLTHKKIPSSDSSPSPTPPDLFESLFDSTISENITEQLSVARVYHRQSITDSDIEMAEASPYTPGYFHGKDGEDPEMFLDNLTAYCSLRNNADVIKILPLALRDGARVWFNNLSEDSKKDITTFKKALLDRYGPADITNFSKVGEIFETRQGPTEKARDYVSRVTHLCSMAKLNDTMTNKALLNGLLPAIRSYVLAKDAKTTQEIEQHAITAELIQPKTEDTSSLVAAMDALKSEIQQLQMRDSRPRSTSPRRVSFSSRSPTPHRRDNNPRPATRYTTDRRLPSRQAPKSCYRCGGRYTPTHYCRALHADCFKCQKRGHFQKCCKQ